MVLFKTLRPVATRIPTSALSLTVVMLECALQGGHVAGLHSGKLACNLKRAPLKSTVVW